MKIKQLWVYPIKSCQGHPIDSVSLKFNGMEFDRNWMIVDDQGLFISQRKIAKMALIVPAIDPKNKIMKLRFGSKKEISIPLEWKQNPIQAQVWQDKADSFKYGLEVSQWLTDALGTAAHLVRLAHPNSRMKTKTEGSASFPVNFADGAPILLTNETSLIALNNYSRSNLQMTRFRPNIITETPQPFDEENWKSLRSKDLIFDGLQPCIRCTIINIDQFTSEKNKSVFSCLENYRKANRLPEKVIFGMRMIPTTEGILSQGDTLYAN